MKNLLFLIGCFLSSSILAQYDIDDAKKEAEKEPKSSINWFDIKKRTYVGGEFSLSLGTFGTYVYTAPLVGFDITEKFSAGISGMYQYQRSVNYNQTFSFSAFGGGVFTRLRPIEPILMQVEYNLFNTIDFKNQTFDRVNVPAFMAGLGYAGDMGSRAYYQVLLMYDFIGDFNMPLPWIITEKLHLKFGFVWYLN